MFRGCWDSDTFFLDIDKGIFGAAMTECEKSG